jgi:hypothetical protein
MPHDTVVAFEEDIQPTYDKACAVPQSTVEIIQRPEAPPQLVFPKANHHKWQLDMNTLRMSDDEDTKLLSPS